MKNYLLSSEKKNWWQKILQISDFLLRRYGVRRKIYNTELYSDELFMKLWYDIIKPKLRKIGNKRKILQMTKF